MTSLQDSTPRIAVGGLDGSGTRVIALILQKMGFYLGPCLNPQMDCILFTLLFKRRDWIASFPDNAEIDRMISIFSTAMQAGVSEAFGHLAEDEVEALFEESRKHGVTRPMFEEILASPAQPSPAPDHGAYSGVAWKEPNTHVFLSRLTARFPNLKYVHVIRNGLDMALSGNRQQLVNWGRLFGIDAKADRPPVETQLDYWLAANRRAIEVGREMPQGQFYLLNYDDLCADFVNEIEPFQAFLDRRLTADEISQLNELIGSDSIGRFRNAPPGTFSEANRDAVRAFGFAVD